MRSRRTGIVLLLALLCIIALELTAAGLHFAAIQQLRTARAGTRALQLRLSAQSAVATALDSWPTVRALATPAGESLPLPATAGRDDRYGIRFGADAERLSSSLFLVRAEARSPLQESARVGYLLVLRDPLDSLGTGAIRAAGAVSVGPDASVAAGSAFCPAEALAAAAQVAGPGSLAAAPEATIDGPIEVRPEFQGATLADLVPFPPDQLLADARDLPVNQVSPAPVVTVSQCDTGVDSNWGEPARSPGAGPCTDWLPLLRRDGDLTINGGRGQGILFVAGNLVLSAGASFSGLVLVAGNLTLSEGATIRGGVVVAGSVLLTNASIEGDRCALTSALARVPAIVGPFSPSTRRWIPMF